MLLLHICVQLTALDGSDERLFCFRDHPSGIQLLRKKRQEDGVAEQTTNTDAATVDASNCELDMSVDENDETRD